MNKLRTVCSHLTVILSLVFIVFVAFAIPFMTGLLGYNVVNVPELLAALGI